MIYQIYRLFNYVLTEKLKNIKTIDIWNNSILNESTEDSIYLYPAVLVEVEPFGDSIKQRTEGVEVANINVKIHVVFNYYKPIDYNIVNDVSKVLNRIGYFSSEENDPEYVIQKLKKVGEIPNHNVINTTLRDVVIRYNFDLVDYSNSNNEKYTITIDNVENNINFYI